MRTRGFEKVSFEQYKKDFLSIWDEKDHKQLEEWVINSYKKIKIPEPSTAKSAGNDFVAPFGFVLKPDEEVLIPLGIKAYMQDNEVLLLFPRSGHGFKYYIRLANTVGVVDCDYYNNPQNEGHCFLKIRNEGNKTMTVNSGDKICQGIFFPYLPADGHDFTGEERNGGFGSTDK